MAEQLFDDELLINDKGEVINDGAGASKQKENLIPEDENDGILINDKGEVIDKDGNLVNPPSNENKDNNGSSQPKSTAGNGTASPEDTSTLPLTAKALFEAGLISDLGNKEDIKAQDLIDAVEATIKENEFADLDDESKRYLEVVRSGGDVKEYLANYQERKDAQATFKEVTDENAEALTRAYYTAKGLGDLEIDDIIDERTVANTLTDKASKLLDPYTELLASQADAKVAQAKQLSDKARLDAQASVKQYKELIDSTDSFVQGQELNDGMRAKIFKLGTTSVGHDKNGNPITALQKAMGTDPQGMEAKLNYLFLITDGFEKMDNLSYSKAGTTSAAQELQEKLAQEQGSRSSGGSVNKNNNNNKPSILDAKF